MRTVTIACPSVLLLGLLVLFWTTGGMVLPAIAQDATVFGFKYHDENCNGEWESDEDGLAGWTVYVDLDGDGQPDPDEPQGSTDASGFVQLKVEPGTHAVAEVLQNGWTPTLPTDGRQSVTLTAGEAADVLFGNIVAGGITGQKFEDVDGDGQKDSGEPGLDGWEITLTGTNCAGNPIERTATTGQDGFYEMADVPPGTYTVRETQQNGFDQTFPAGEGTYTLDVESNSTVIAVDFGNRRAPTGSISGFKFEDRNGDGVPQDEEPRIAGWTVFLDLNANGVLDGGDASTVTAADDPATAEDETGTYVFSNLPQGEYQVLEVQQPGWRQTTAQHTAFFLPAGATITNVTFGNQGTGSIEGYKFIDWNENGVRDEGEGGLEGVVIFMDENGNGEPDPGERSTTTGAGGLFRFSDLPPGDYQLQEVVPPGWRRTTPQVTVITLEPGQFVEGEPLFGNVPGVEIIFDWGDAPDTYRTRFANFGAVHAILPGFFLGARFDAEEDGQPHAVALGDDLDANGDDEDGVIFHDLLKNGDRVDITVTASRASFLTAWVDFDGDGVFEDPGERIFAAEPLRAGANALSFAVPATATPGSPAFSRFRQTRFANVVEPGGFSLGGEVEDHIIGGTGELHGRKYHDDNANGILEPGEPGLADWTIFLDENGNGLFDPGEESTTTMSDDFLTPQDESGWYWFTDLTPGTYVVGEVQKPGWIQSAPRDTVDLVHTVTLEAGEIIDSLHFGNYRYAELGGRKFEDLNANAVIDVREPGRGGWRIDLLLDDELPVLASTTTEGLPVACDEGDHFLDRCLGAADEFPGVLMLTLDLDLDGEADLEDLYSGRLRLRRADPADAVTDHDTHGDLGEADDHMDVVLMEIVELVTTENPGWLSNAGFRLTAGDGIDNLESDGPLHSAGAIIETSSDVRKADSHFELFFELEPNETFGLPTLHNETPLRLQARTDRIFPGDVKWHDVLQTNGPLPLHDASGKILAQVVDAVMTPSEPGTYSFHVPPTPSGSYYRIREFLKPDWTQSFPQTAGHKVIATSGDVMEDLDFANVEFGTIRGQLFDDENGNGARDPGEEAVNGFLDLDGDGVLDSLTFDVVDERGNVFHTTAADVDLNLNARIEAPTERGIYQFTLMPGIYGLRQGGPLNGLVQTMPADSSGYLVYIGNGELFESLDFGNRLASSVGIGDGASAIPAEFGLHANYPNPFNPATTIRYDVGAPGPVRLHVFDVLGRQVAVLVDEDQTPGTYAVRFEAAGLPSGIYVYRLDAGTFSAVKTMLLIK